MALDHEVFAVDTDFLHACRQAAGILKSRESRDARIKATADLVSILLSDRQIGMGERQYLAELLVGDLDRPHARPGLSADQKEVRRERAWMVRQYQMEQASKGRKIGVPEAVQELADSKKLLADDVETLINFMGRSRKPKA